VLPELDPAIGHKVHRMPTVEVRVTDRCVGCGLCTADVCFVDAIRLQDGRAVIDDACRGCGRCLQVCPQRAIELVYDPSSSVESTVQRLASLVDVT
jgi:UDP-glucose 4-epimerase